MKNIRYNYKRLLLIGTIMSAGLLASSTLYAAAVPPCGLGQPDCDLPAGSHVEIPVALKWGLEYKCSIRSAEEGHKINGAIEGANGFVYGPETYIASTTGYDTILEGSFAEGKTEGHIIVKNFSLYDGKASCSRTG